MLIADGGGGAPMSTKAGGVDMLPGMAAIGALINSAVEIALNAAQIAEVNVHLDDAETYLAEAKGKLSEIPGGAVGGSPVGQQLSHHSKLANDALLDTLSAMEKGVIYYRDSIKIAVDKMTDADEVAGATARRGEGQFSPTPSGSGA